MGAYLQKLGVKRAYLMTTNNQAGKDMISGFKRFYKNEVVGEVYTRFGQVDFAAELSELRSAQPDATFIFYPGDMGVQYRQAIRAAGIMKSSPLYTVWTVDQASLPAIGRRGDRRQIRQCLERRSSQHDQCPLRKGLRLQERFLPNDYAAHAC